MPSVVTASRFLVGLVLVLSSSSVAAGQNAGSDSTRCDSVPQYGLRTDTLAAQLSIEPADALPTSWEEMLLAGISEHFTMPPTSGTPVYDGSKSVDGRDLVSISIVGEVMSYLTRDGSLSDPLISVSTLSPEIDRRLIAAIRDLDLSRAIPPLPSNMKVDSVRVRYSISEHPDSGRIARPLNVVQQPTWVLDRPVFARRDNPSPRYPREGERARVGDEVLVSFVVDNDGRARMETVRMLRGRYREFQLAVLDVLPRMRFYPARIAGCPVAQLVQMPFSFRVPD